MSTFMSTKACRSHTMSNIDLLRRRIVSHIITHAMTADILKDLGGFLIVFDRLKLFLPYVVYLGSVDIWKDLFEDVAVPIHSMTFDAIADVLRSVS